MKIIYISLIVNIVFYSSIIVAQPIFNQSDLTPQIGQNFEINVVTSGTFSAGNAGANQTWDFSNINGSSALLWQVVDASTTPNFSLFPGSDIALYHVSNSYTYYQSTLSAYYKIGSHHFGGTQITIYDDPQQLVSFPLSFNTTFVDSFSNNSKPGIIEVTADGYGTLITPEGTYSNVLRVKSNTTYNDTSISGRLWYDFYALGTPYPLLTYNVVSINPTVVYLSASSIGIENITSSNLQIFPNPASENLRLTLNIGKRTEIEVSIWNMIGQEMMIFSDVTNGLYQKDIDVSGFTSGIYLLKTKINDETTSRLITIL